jgi:hypothetical protein
MNLRMMMTNLRIIVGMSSNPWFSVLREYSFLDCVLNFKSTDYFPTSLLM